MGLISSAFRKVPVLGWGLTALSAGEELTNRARMGQNSIQAGLGAAAGAADDALFFGLAKPFSSASDFLTGAGAKDMIKDEVDDVANKYWRRLNVR